MNLELHKKYNYLKNHLNQNKMTPKEKARKLVQRFIAHAYHNNNELQCKDHSKQCALIAVDEKINFFRQIILDFHLDENEKALEIYRNLKEVKQEIINL